MSSVCDDRQYSMVDADQRYKLYNTIDQGSNHIMLLWRGIDSITNIDDNKDKPQNSHTGGIYIITTPFDDRNKTIISKTVTQKVKNKLFISDTAF